MPTAADNIAVGKLVGGHGVRGLAKIHPFNPGSPALLQSAALTLVPNNGGAPKTFPVVESRMHKRIILARLEGLASLNALQSWIGSEVQIPQAGLPEIGGDEIYHWEAIGLEVRTVDGQKVGRITEVLALPANDLWVVRDAGRESLIPVVDAIVLEVDLPNGIATIDPPEGLIPDKEA